MRLKVVIEDEKMAKGAKDSGEREKESYLLNYFFCVFINYKKKKKNMWSLHQCASAPVYSVAKNNQPPKVI